MRQEEDKQNQTADNANVVEESSMEYSAKTEEYRDTINNLIDFFEGDIRWKLTARKRYSLIFSLCLLLQNIVVYGFVYHVYRQGSGSLLKDLQPIISVLVIGTIGQTVAVIRIMVRWIFSDIDYSQHPLNGNSKKRSR